MKIVLGVKQNAIKKKKQSYIFRQKKEKTGYVKEVYL